MPAPEAYEAKLPADLKLPDGTAYTVDAANPALSNLRTWANARGIDQAGFSEMLGMLATYESSRDAIVAERSKAEIAKAGPNAPQRVDTVGKWIDGEMGKADAAPIRATIVTDAHLRFYEKMMTKIASQGAASFSQQHRVAPDAKEIPGYEGMSFEQRRFAQDQRAGRKSA